MVIFGKLNLDTDFEYRVIREEENDLDLFIDLNYRSLDIKLEDSNFFNSRVQFPFVRSIILRLNKESDIITMHLMRDIDLFSAFANFEINISNSIISIKNEYEKVVMYKSIK
ncbi:hypothetical protein PN290_10640 [Romboutsia sp. 1001216sp1]|uniref:hypothetical protein n=1 Tax=unclassified Romboutsia TaxID=2626894 RepID=UPI00189F19EC|nr:MULTISPECIES: hypothetical protein [unclassified Romboutsia]MDB8789473.1 hypothetical protein [Romboutsia sp. 1001216sp1]MDB8793917.1 hypothetical protein [Romboutsia sp. 1001216sp1]MDB8796624.1 hypothetical protein [Romboutsia sp. 1001216sp1]MDB8799829.1 hypothetical protein [Romboutsia sp. 1001216sp1]MDB8802616.1 hypothetical protein [Romboutsia sp. 1001216sp1]